VNLRLKVTPWKNDHATTLEAADATILLCRGIEADGKEVFGKSATITLHADFAGKMQDFIALRLEGAEEMWTSLDLDDVILGSTPDDFRVIVTSLELEYV
jgi:hypothetical protein